MVKPGYKQTEMGVIPEDWDVVAVETLATDMSDGPFGSNLKKDHYTDEKQARIIQLSNIGEDGWIDSNVKYTTFSHAKTLSRCIVQPGHIIIAKMMPAGRAIICPHTEKMYILGSDAIKLQLNNALVDTLYFMYSTKSDFFQTQIKEETQGSTRARTSISKLRKNKVILPPVVEQNRIAEALSNVDSMISSLEKLIAKKKAIKQGAMQELLTGKKRLPGFTGEWHHEPFGKLCTICRGGSPRPIQDYLTTSDSGINWIKIGDVKPNAKYITSTQEKIVESGVSMSRRVYKGDFILSNSMSFGRPYILKLDGCIHDGWLAIQDYQVAFDTDFLYYVLGSNYVFEQYIQMAAGSSVQNLNKEKVAQLKLYIPALEEQNAIASILSDMDNEIEALEQKLKKTRQVKQGMMQQLLTGKIRLVSANADNKPIEAVSKPHHNHQFDDAVVIAAIVNEFYTDVIPLGRKKVQKLLYLLRRKQEADTSAFKKKAAGPYADEVRYKGGEPIAVRNKYVVKKQGVKGTTFSKGEKIESALEYIEKWEMNDDINWLVSTFKYTKTNDLELFATIDMAICDLINSGEAVSVASIKNLIASNKEWKDKLSKTYFSDNDIARAIRFCQSTFN